MWPNPWGDTSRDSRRAVSWRRHRLLALASRKRVDDSLAALQTALEGRPDISTEELQADIDQANVAPYKKMRPIMVLPAIYVLDGSGALVQMLQGEVTTGQITEAVGGGGRGPIGDLPAGSSRSGPPARDPRARCLLSPMAGRSRRGLRRQSRSFCHRGRSYR